MKLIIYLYLALLIWIIEIALFVSVVFIPIVYYLRFTYEWWADPINTAILKS